MNAQLISEKEPCESSGGGRADVCHWCAWAKGKLSEVLAIYGHLTGSWNICSCTSYIIYGYILFFYAKSELQEIFSRPSSPRHLNLWQTGCQSRGLKVYGSLILQKAAQHPHWARIGDPLHMAQRLWHWPSSGKLFHLTPSVPQGHRTMPTFWQPKLLLVYATDDFRIDDRDLSPKVCHKRSLNPVLLDHTLNATTLY